MSWERIKFYIPIVSHLQRKENQDHFDLKVKKGLLRSSMVEGYCSRLFGGNVSEFSLFYMEAGFNYFPQNI